jgi:hypothetical protein
MKALSRAMCSASLHRDLKLRNLRIIAGRGQGGSTPALALGRGHGALSDRWTAHDGSLRHETVLRQHQRQLPII